MSDATSAPPRGVRRLAEAADRTLGGGVGRGVICVPLLSVTGGARFAARGAAAPYLRGVGRREEGTCNGGDGNTGAPSADTAVKMLVRGDIVARGEKVERGVCRSSFVWALYCRCWRATCARHRST